MSDEYFVIGKTDRAEMKVKASLFIASGAEVHSREAAEDFIRDVAREFRSADHNCFAYRVGAEGAGQAVFRHADDGEPAGTAGEPIYRVMCGENITNSVIVVTRFFGGTKLGTGGLVKAYTRVTQQLIESAGIKKLILLETVTIRCDHQVLPAVLNVVHTGSARLVRENFSDLAEIVVEVPATAKAVLLDTIIRKTRGNVLIS